MTLGEAARLIRKAVEENDTSPETLKTIRKFLSVEEKMAVVKIPLKKIAMAGLHMLGVEEYTGDDEDVLYFIEIFKHLND